MERINNFDVLKRMSADNLDIRMAPNSNITLLKKVKAGTQVTIGVQGDVISSHLHRGIDRLFSALEQKAVRRNQSQNGRRRGEN